MGSYKEGQVCFLVHSLRHNEGLMEAVFKKLSVDLEKNEISELVKILESGMK